MDQDFDPNVDSYLNDLDDEETLEEEENKNNNLDHLSEIEKLKQESEMPIEQLLQMYKYGAQQNSNKNTKLNSNDENEEEEEEMSSEDEEDDEEDDDDDDDEENGEEEEEDVENAENEHKKQNESDKLNNKSENDLLNLIKNSSYASDFDGNGEEDEEEDEDYDFDPESVLVRKKIKIGNEFQIDVETNCKQLSDEERLSIRDYDDLLWSSFKLDEQCVNAYLKKIQADIVNNSNNLKENENALFILNTCNYDVDEAIKKFNEAILNENKKVILWTEEKNEAFEEGLRQYGKEFPLIKEKLLNELSVGQIVTYYYIWKKSEKHDVFITKYKIKKKPFLLNPAITDFMEKFMFDREQSLAQHQKTINTTPTSLHLAQQQSSIDAVETLKKDDTQSTNEKQPQESLNNTTTTAHL